MEKLKRFQIIYLNGMKYVVQNMIEFHEEKWIWQEYEVVKDGGYEREWLTVEVNDAGQMEYYLYKKYNGFVNKQENICYAFGKKFTSFDQGIARVKAYFGNADVDIGERCSYKDYISEDRKTIISIEDWSDGTERTIGEFIDPTAVKITNEFDSSRNSVINDYTGNNNTMIATILGIAIIPVVLMVIILIIAGAASHSSIQRYLEKNKSKYTYVTSVTNNVDGKKAKVYEATSTDIDAVVKDIIDGMPEGITDTFESDDGISLQTKKEYAYIYKEENKVYIQVSSLKYVEDNGTTYHSRHYSHYHSTYRSRNRSRFYTYWSSARQQSINSRKSSGGGTSSGK